MLIPYDISDDKRRREVDKILSAYGKRVNYSVFEVEVNASKFRKLIKELEAVTVEKDHVRIYTLSKEVVNKSFLLHRDEGIFEDDELYF